MSDVAKLLRESGWLNEPRRDESERPRPPYLRLVVDNTRPRKPRRNGRERDSRGAAEAITR